MKKQLGKKVIVLSLVGAMALTTLTACGEKENPATKVVEYNIDDYVTLGAYTGLDVTEKITIITDKDVEDQLDMLVENNITYKEMTDRNVIDGDRITVDYVRKAEGEEDKTQNGFVFKLGNGSMPKAFDEKMIGLAKDATLTFTIDEEVSTTNTSTDGKETEGKTTVSATYTVTLTKIEEEVVPEVTDAFIKEKTDYDTIAAYKEGTKKELEETSEENAKMSAQADLLNMIIEKSKIEGTPAFVYNMNYDAICQSYAQYATYFGYDLETYLQASGLKLDDMKKDAVEMTKQTLVIEAICKAADIDITDEEFDKKLDEIVTEYQYESKEELLKLNTKEELLFDMRRDAAIEYIYENNNVTQEYVEAEEAE